MNESFWPILVDGEEGLAGLSQVIPMLYGELRRMAGVYFRGERGERILQPTALVHETLLRLTKPGAGPWKNRAHFFGAAAKAMRRTLIEHARARRSRKRGRGWQAVPLDEARLVPMNVPDYERIDDLLQRLERVDPLLSQIVEFRVFGGLSSAEIAILLHKGESTIRKQWALAKIWLRKELRDSGHDNATLAKNQDDPRTRAQA
jgi:RNA polymerase sigma factor (TIGR02999 family)